VAKTIKNCFTIVSCFLHSCVAQLKEFQQKSSPASVGGEKGGGGVGGAGAKKKRKVKGLSQLDASTTDRDSPDNVMLLTLKGFLFSNLFLCVTVSLRSCCVSLIKVRV